MLIQNTSSIVLQTRKGTNIENTQNDDHMIYAEQIQCRDIEKNFPGVIYRGKPTGLYNCHGMVFACRRTGVHDPNEVQKILSEDGYHEVTDRNEVLPGDIVVYFAGDGEIDHSAIVLSSPKDESLHVPKVVSKWGKFREAIHSANQCPYKFASVKYYRIVGDS